MINRYHVSFLHSEKRKHDLWGVWCRQNGRATEFIRALRILFYRLTQEPREDWSEPFTDIPTMNVQVRFGAQDFLSVIYAVPNVKSVVMVKKVQWIGVGGPPNEIS